MELDWIALRLDLRRRRVRETDMQTDRQTDVHRLAKESKKEPEPELDSGEETK